MPGKLKTDKERVGFLIYVFYVPWNEPNTTQNSMQMDKVKSITTWNGTAQLSVKHGEWGRQNVWKTNRKREIFICKTTQIKHNNVIPFWKKKQIQKKHKKEVLCTRWKYFLFTRTMYMLNASIIRYTKTQISFIIPCSFQFAKSTEQKSYSKTVTNKKQTKEKSSK